MQYTVLVLVLVLAALSICVPACAWKQEELIVTYWCPPPATDEALAQAAAEGYTMTWVPEAGLDVAARHGLKGMLQDGLLNPKTLDDPAAKAQLDQLIERVKNHPALEAYYITDEPGSGAFPGLGRLVAYLKEKDPKHLAYINLFPTYASAEQLGVSADAAERQRVGLPDNFAGKGNHTEAALRYNEHLQQFIEVVRPELISYDHYHFMLNGKDGRQYFLNLALIRDAAKSVGLPFLNIIQASRIEKVWRMPNKHEERWLVYTTLAYGGRGISYFLYWGPESYEGLYRDGKPIPLVKDVVRINAELNVLGPEMLKLDSTAVYQSEPLPVGGVAIPADCPVKPVDKGQYVIGLFSNEGKIDTFMIVNRDYRKASGAKLVFPENVRALKEFNRKSGKWRTFAQVKPGQPVTVALNPGDGRLLRIVYR